MTHIQNRKIVLMSSNSPVVETIKSTTQLALYIYIEYKCVKLDEGWKLSPNA